MKKHCTLFLFLLSITSLAQKPIIAIVEPQIIGETEIEKKIIIGELSNAIDKYTGYETVTRSKEDINLIIKEKSFRDVGMVNIEQCNELGQVLGVDYICVSSLTKSPKNFYFEVYLLHLETGKRRCSVSKFGEVLEDETFAGKLYSVCQVAAKELAEKLSSTMQYNIIGYKKDKEEGDICDKLYNSKVIIYSNNSAWNNHQSIPEDALIKISLFAESAKNKQYEDAWKPWKEVYEKWPNSSLAIYQYGEQMAKWYISKADSEQEYEKYKKLLMEIYDKRIHFFGDSSKYPKAYILGKKGVSLFTYSTSDDDKVLSYFILREAVSEMQDKCNAEVLYCYYQVSAYLYKYCYQHQIAFDSDFQIVRGLLRNNIEGNSDVITKVLHNIESDYSRLRDVYVGSFDSSNVIVDNDIEFDNEEEIQTVFVVVEQMPEFPGGQDSLFQYLNANIKYPVIAQECNVQGKVIVQFTVEKDGSISDVRVAKTILRTWEWVEGKDGSRLYVKVEKSIGPALDGSAEGALEKEAVRLISSMPRWKPGSQRGKNVRVKYTIPIDFILQ